MLSLSTVWHQWEVKQHCFCFVFIFWWHRRFISVEAVSDFPPEYPNVCVAFMRLVSIPTVIIFKGNLLSIPATQYWVLGVLWMYALYFTIINRAVLTYFTLGRTPPSYSKRSTDIFSSHKNKLFLRLWYLFWCLIGRNICIFMGLL